MFYLKFGVSKKYIVFLHGWGADRNSFLWLKDYFSNYSLIFVDFPGFGNSPEPEKPYRVFDYVSELKNLLDSFHIDELVLVGHSFGGRVAIKYSFLFSKEYKQFGLCLVDSAGILPRRTIGYYFKVHQYKWLKKKAQKDNKFVKKLARFGSNDYKKLSNAMKETFTLIVNEDLSSEAKFISCKTLIVWGKRDFETKLYMAKKLNKLIKNSTLKVIDNAGHFSFLDDPQEFVIILDSYLKKL